MSFCKCDSPQCTDAAVKRERPDLDSLAAGIAADILDSDWFRERDARIKAEALREAARFFEYEMAPAWGGGLRWISTGANVADLVANVLRERADEAEGES